MKKIIDKFDLIYLAFFALFMIWVKYPLLGVERHWEMFLVLRYLPDSLLEVLFSVFDRWPPGSDQGWIYRPITMTIMPFLYFKAFGWNHHYWLACSMVFSSLIPVLLYILTKVLTGNRIAAVFSSLFVYSYYIFIFTRVEYYSYEPASLFILLYLAVVIFFLMDLERPRLRYALAINFLFILGLMSKENVATLPFILLTAIFVYPNRDQKVKLKKIFVRLSPVIVIWLGYIIFRFIVPMLNGAMDTRPGGKQILGLNISTISDQVHGMIKYTFHKNYYLTVPTETLYGRLLFVLFIYVVIMSLFQLTRRNRVIIFGLIFYLMNLTPYILLEAPFGMHYLMASIVGVGIVFGEIIKVTLAKISILTSYWPRKYKNLLFGVLIGGLGTILIVNSYVGVKQPLNYLASNADSKALNAIYTALPQPEFRTDKTLFFIKNSHPNTPEGTKYYTCIKPAYYGKKDLVIVHEHNLEAGKTQLSRMDAKIYNIIVLEHVNLFETNNITSEKTIKEITKYMKNH